MFNITSGNITAGILYQVYGTQSVTYNGITYLTSQTFRGVSSITTFTFSGSGTQLVYEVSEFAASAVIFDESLLDEPIFIDKILFHGSSIEFQQNAGDIIFNDVTTLRGFSIELLDYPFYAFAITERSF